MAWRESVCLMYMTTEHVRAHKLIDMLITSYPSSSQVYTNKLKQTPEVSPQHLFKRNYDL